MKVIDNPVCPKCKDEEILWQEVISMHYDEEGVYLKVRGECLECGTEYEWVEHYEFSHNSKLKERGKTL